MKFHWRVIIVALFIPLMLSSLAIGEKVHLTFMTFGPDSLIAGFQQVIEGFEEENPGVSIELQPATGPTDLRDKALVAFAGGVGPDLIGGDDAVAYALMAADGLLELSDLIESDPHIGQIEDSLLPGLWEMATYGGKRFTIPMGVALEDWYINVDHFHTSGLALPTEDWNWDQFLHVAKRLTMYDGSEIVRAGYVLEVHALHEILPWIIQAGGLPFDDWSNPTESLFSTPQVREALRFLYDLRWEHAVVPRPGELPGGSVNIFMQDKVSMLTHWPARVGQFARAELPFKWKVQQAPQNKERAVIGAIDGLKIGSQTKHPDIAWEFLKYLVRPDVQRILAPNFQIPAVQEVAMSDDWLESPVPGLNKIAFLKDAQFLYNRAQNPAVASDVDRVFLEEWNMAFDGGKYPIEHMVQSVDERLNAILTR
ncbi:MAG: sugar ABC transporter substrate-binding protein [Limnochordia bacterium]|nr:sugar ABC transporter substrate-binding protein [Limnochordia bacterium]